MLSLLSAAESTAAAVVPPAVADMWQLLSACTTNIGAAHASATLAHCVLPSTSACLVCATKHQHLAVKDVGSRGFMGQKSISKQIAYMQGSG